MKKLAPAYLLFALIALASCHRPERHLVISKIRSTAQLATTETVIDKIVIGGKSRRVFGIINVSNAEFVAYTQAIVKTGINLTKLKKDDVRIRNKTIEIEFPAVEVLDFSFPFDSFRIDPILSDDDIFNRIDVVDQEFYYRKAEIDIRNNLEFMGIKEQTEENTRKMMESLLKNLGYEEIYISFSDSGKFVNKVNLKITD